MDEIDSKNIAEAWLNFQKNWWAWDKLDELCRKDARGAWAVLTELVDQARSGELIEDIGVGPLEDFVNYYAAEFIGELESRAQTSKAFTEALGHVQLRDASHPLASRIAALGCRVSTAGKASGSRGGHD
jgi:hypothetical protein